ncbi:MAG: Adenosylmethionine--8-amino-7-oxononanoate transaminase [Bacteroidota bacterium]|jgi:adenosylmethionine-8-amino-7-oxononanoate aminotransferase
MQGKSKESYSNRDKKVIWHPFTQHQIDPYSIAIVKGEGVNLIDENGASIIDSISSWWVNLHGHSNAYINQKIAEQAKELEHVIFAGFTHPPAIELAERILGKTNDYYQKVFYSDNGSTAIEVAIKMALQYFYNQGILNKKKILAFEHSYHGDTFGAMSLGTPSSFNAPFEEFLFEVEFLPDPSKEEECVEKMEEILSKDDSYAAFIYEPLVQGAGGMNMYTEKALERYLKIAQKYGLLTIADEIMTGFGRLGKFFASDYIDTKPDIMCLSKGLTGGVMAMGLTLCQDKIYDSFLSEDRRKTFFHSHSFSGNPLTCAAALASLDLMERPETMENIKRINKFHLQEKEKLSTYSNIQNVRIKGTIIAFEIMNELDSNYLNPIRDIAYNFCLKNGVLIRPLGNTIYLLPPYIISNEELKKVYTVIYSMIENFLKKS